MKHISFKIFLLFTISLLASCGGNTSSTTNTEQSQTSVEYTSAYICPMHCEGSGSDSAGMCPVCGMDYVVNETTGSQKKNH